MDNGLTKDRQQMENGWTTDGPQIDNEHTTDGQQIKGVIERMSHYGAKKCTLIH